MTTAVEAMREAVDSLEATVAEDIRRSRECDDFIIRARDAGHLTVSEAWQILAALAEGRSAIREREIQRKTLARLAERPASPAVGDAAKGDAP